MRKSKQKIYNIYYILEKYIIYIIYLKIYIIYILPVYIKNIYYIYIYIYVYLARSDVKGKRMSKKATLRGKGDVRGK